jgi:hypothetical protein
MEHTLSGLCILSVWVAFSGWMIASALDRVAAAIREGNDKHK